MPKLKARKLDAPTKQQAIAAAQWLIGIRGGLSHEYSRDYWRFSTKAELCGQVEAGDRFVQGRAKGDQGPPGPAGPKGDQGSPGPAGSAGSAGLRIVSGGLSRRAPPMGPGAPQEAQQLVCVCANEFAQTLPFGGSLLLTRVRASSPAMRREGLRPTWRSCRAID